MELNFKHHLLAGTMLAGGALFGMCGVPTVAQAATCTTIVDNSGIFGGGTTNDCTDLITVAKTARSRRPILPGRPTMMAPTTLSSASSTTRRP